MVFKVPKRTGNAHVTSRRVSTSSGRTLRRTTLTHLCGFHRQWLLLGKILRLVHGATCGAWAPKNLPWGRNACCKFFFFCTEEKHKNRNTDYTCFLHMANSVRPCLPGGVCVFFSSRVATLSTKMAGKKLTSGIFRQTIMNIRAVAQHLCGHRCCCRCHAIGGVGCHYEVRTVRRNMVSVFCYNL